MFHSEILYLLPIVLYLFCFLRQVLTIWPPKYLQLSFCLGLSSAGKIVICYHTQLPVSSQIFGFIKEGVFHTSVPVWICCILFSF